MSRRYLSESQLSYLRAIRAFEHEGFAEIELRWASETGIPRYLEGATAVRTFDSLVRKGLADRDEYGAPILTDAGRQALDAFREVAR